MTHNETLSILIEAIGFYILVKVLTFAADVLFEFQDDWDTAEARVSSIVAAIACLLFLVL